MQSTPESNTGLVFDPVFLDHRGPEGHPEHPGRLSACIEALRQRGLIEAMVPIPARAARREELERVHSPFYLDRLENEIRGREGFLDVDTFFSPRSLEAACSAAGGVIDLVESIRTGHLRTGLALVRPPGHHAERSSPGGFCLLNNIALGAAAVRRAGLRPAIVDFDVHHGNGTQHLFYEDPDTLYISVHRFDPTFYPGTGSLGERGAGAGEGATLNLPLRRGSDGTQYRQVFVEAIGPALRRFSPDLLLVSAGFDAHQRDTMGGMALTDRDFEEIGMRLRDWAGSLCGERWAVVLEGGYDEHALGHGVSSLAQVLLGADP